LLLSLAVALMGLVDVFSAILSHPPERLMALRHIVPTDVLDTSRTFTLLAGALLLVTAWGLRRGKRRAFVTALFLCALSVPVNLLKAFDFEEATVATALMFALGVSGEAFRVKSRALSLGALRSGAMWGALALLAYAFVGSWVLEHSLGVEPSLRRAFADAGYRMFGIGDPVQLAPRIASHHAQRVLTWYLRSLPVLSLTLMLGVAIGSLRPVRHRSRHRAEAGRVTELMREHGDSSVAWFALADDTDYFFSRNGRAVIPYLFESDVLLAIGDPIGPQEELRPLLEEFASFCDERDWTWAFFQASPARLPMYRVLGWRALHIGEDPVLDPATFTVEGGALGNARRSARKASDAGLVVRHFVPGHEPFDAAHAPAGWTEQMRAISHDWLRAHPGGEKGFCMGRFDPHRLPDEWLAVAWNEPARRIEGFLTWVPVPARQGWALDLMRRRVDAHQGAMELLVIRSVDHARTIGVEMLSLSLSALAKVDEPDATAPAVNPAAANVPATPPAEPDRARAFLMEHLARFYDFKGLFLWKRKFNPRFEDRYLVYPAPFALPRVVLALVRAQTPGGIGAYFRAPAATPPATPTAHSASEAALTPGTTPTA
jgi:phosphatidylglycerol lysyltransferase